LFERECSIQRRYQKIIEETPSPFLDPQTRQAMAEAAVAAARAVEYVNAGTIEFIVDADRRFYFMEMNTRLQVEHPVTEMTTGLDLVEWQLRVAAGEALPLAQPQIESHGHAIEARIYAENPAREFLPSTGRVDAFSHPPAGPGLRVDAAVAAGDAVSSHYDPMIAKLIVHAADRDQAVALFAHTLERTMLEGPLTNLPLLRRIARNAVFRRGDVDTRYIDSHLDDLLDEDDVPRVRWLAAAARILRERASGAMAQSPASPWSQLDGWQPIASAGRRLALECGGQRVNLEMRGTAGRYVARIGAQDLPFTARELSGHDIEITTDRARVLTVIGAGGQWLVADDQGASQIAEVAAFPVERVIDDERAHPGSPLPGRVVAVEVEPGDRVEAGAALVIVEGMKMEHTVRARAAGTVERVLVRAGDSIEADAPLVDIRPASSTDAAGAGS
ncbi:MAG TPA: biotin/lipoyl-containing protein, partial [Steroidobacteraceae bacterium]|nr:biotin/lipoyl-containing protein [Steroidobacteraceae bacterium]